ncbi:hypothetical protein MRX96_005040 [Rhipicephalus microplus]
MGPVRRRRRTRPRPTLDPSPLPPSRNPVHPFAPRELGTRVAPKSAPTKNVNEPLGLATSGHPLQNPTAAEMLHFQQATTEGALLTREHRKSHARKFHYEGATRVSLV